MGPADTRDALGLDARVPEMDANDGVALGHTPVALGVGEVGRVRP